MPPVRLEANELAELLGGQLVGESRAVTQLSPPDAPQPDAAVVVRSADELESLATAELGVIIIPTSLESSSRQPLIKVDDARVAFARLSALFDTRPQQAEGIHASAVIDPTAQLGSGVSIGANVVVEAEAVIGDACTIGAGCIIGPSSTLGQGCRLHPGAILCDGVRLGERVVVQSGAVIGSDSFSYAPSPQGAVKIHHLGSVEVADDVEIGATTVIDRGTLGPTHIGARSKIGAQCIIGHNVQIGSDCLLVSGVGIAGSSRLGKRVTVGGRAGFVDHITVGDGATIAAAAVVTKSVPAGQTWAGSPAQPHKKFVRGLYLQGQLERIWQTVKPLGAKEQHD